MRTFFKKPSWAAKPTDDSNDEFYRRSGQTYSDIVAAAREERKKAKSRSQAAKLAKKDENSPDEETQPTKRTRLSDQSQHRETASPAETSSKPESPVKSPTPSSAIPEDSIQISTILQSPEEDDQSNSPQLSAPELQLKQDLANLDTPTIIPIDDTPDPLTNQDNNTRDFTSEETPDNAALPTPPQPTVTPHPAPDDPIVQILITSEIQGTKPLLVNRKMSQRLQEVRQEWCHRQGFGSNTRSSIYLTWQGRRLFDVTTCKSLGIKRTNIMENFGLDDDFVAEQEELRIHMVAVTDDPALLNRHSPFEVSGKLTPAPNDRETPEATDSAPMKLILRSPGFDDLRVKARPSTIVSKLAAAFRDKRNVPSGHEVRLFFDGDLLHTSSCLGDNDIADLDMVDVQVRPQS